MGFLMDERSEHREELKATLLRSAEGRLLLAGVGVALVYSVWLGAKMLLDPADSQVLVGMTATQVMFGRIAGMAFGYSMNLGHWAVIGICVVIESVQVLIMYPLFVFSWRHLVEFKRLKRFFERTRKVAELHRDKVQRYGIIGLFIFVLFPSWMTGPVVGCVIGFLIGLRLWVNMAAVLGGSCAAILIWAFLLGHLHERAASFSWYAAMVLVILLAIVVFLGHFLQRGLKGGRGDEDEQ